MLQYHRHHKGEIALTNVKGDFITQPNQRKMENFFKKAMGLFVDFVPEGQEHPQQNPDQPDFIPAGINAANRSITNLGEDAAKFEKHFTALFENSNLPGPDYFEFWKMMEALSAHVPEEHARMAAVFATLRVQGLSKEKLLQSARQYSEILENDKQLFEAAAGQKLKNSVDDRKIESENLLKENAANAGKIRELSAAIAANQEKVKQLQLQIQRDEQRLEQNKNGYHLASEAMLAKIKGDINKIDKTL